MCNYNAYIGVTFSCFFSALLFFSFVGDADALTANDSVSTTDLAESLLFSILETVVFARIFLKELLADRNTVLAENIVSMKSFFLLCGLYIVSHSSRLYGKLEQCRNYETVTDISWLDKLFNAENSDDKSNNAVYAPNSVSGKPEEGKVVVAVLGLAHLNGIKKLLTEVN